ncbi:hypothetical protein SUGI_0820610 [Cryptomeria japonica]|nr:hypothetical protein SUGI_0820610 [Cryptomeria japonica]
MHSGVADWRYGQKMGRARVVDARSSPSSTTNGNVLNGSHARTSPTAKGDKDVRASSGATAGGKHPNVVLANASGTLMLQRRCLLLSLGLFKCQIRSP